MVPHSDDQDGASSFIIATEPILAGGVNFRDDFFLFGDLVRPVIFIPFDPIPPHLNDLFFLELSSNTETCNCMNVSVELFLLLKAVELFPENADDFLLVGLHLCELAVGDEEGIGSFLVLHGCCCLG